MDQWFPPFGHHLLRYGKAKNPGFLSATSSASSRPGGGPCGTTCDRCPASLGVEGLSTMGVPRCRSGGSRLHVHGPGGSGRDALHLRPLSPGPCNCSTSLPTLKQAWEMLSRWETLEPTQHRPPLPEPILQAMCSLRLAWGLRNWVCATLICFYGCCRIDEVLQALRSDLLLLREDHRCLLQMRSQGSARHPGVARAYRSLHS